MHDLEHKLLDFPDEPKDLDWEKEALLFYYYMLKEEDKNEAKVKKIFEKFKKILVGSSESSLAERQKIFNELKVEIYNIKNKDKDFERALSFILITTKVINDLESIIEYNKSSKTHTENIINIIPNASELIQKEVYKSIINSEDAVIKAINRLTLIINNESWRYVNETRLDEFNERGYEYKTTYPVLDDRTGEDSLYYYSLRQVKPIDEPFEYTWKGKERVFMTPPDRPNDRNVLIPFVGSYSNSVKEARKKGLI